MFPWKFWSKGAGLIGCHNDASLEFMIELTKHTTWVGKTYRAWKQGEYGYSTLLTMVLPPESLDIIKKDDVVSSFLKQNALEGKHSVPRFNTKPKGVNIITTGVAPEMVVAIRALRGRAPMGAIMIKMNI